MTLPAHLQAIHAAGGHVYEVGGVVRDHLLGRDHKDADLLVRGLAFAQLQELLRKFGAVHGVGQSFGVIKFQPHGHTGEPIDVALPRRERSTGSGHRDFDVDYDPSLPLEDDLGRRDFTINAIARDLKTGELVDPFKGRADLEARLLRMVFPRAFEEDPLRILRGIQFVARLGMKVEPGTLAAMRREADSIVTVSSERVAQELRKLLTAVKPSTGFYLMREVGVMRHLLPEIEALTGVLQPGKGKEIADAFDHTMKVIDAASADTALEHAGDATLLLAALFHDVGKASTRKEEANGRITFHGHQFVSKKLARRRLDALKISNIGVKADEVLTLVENHMFDTGPEFTDKALRRFARKLGTDLVFKQIDLRIADNRGGAHPHNIQKHLNLRKRIRSELEKKAPFGLKDLAIDGNDLIQRGYQPGPDIGKKLNELLELVLDDPSLNTKDELLKHI